MGWRSRQKGRAWSGSASVAGIPILSKNLLLSKKLGFSTASRRDASEAGKENSEIIRIWRPLCGETLSCKRVALQGKAFSRSGTYSAPPSAPGGRWPTELCWVWSLWKWTTDEQGSQSTFGMRGVNESSEDVALALFKCIPSLWRDGKIPLFFWKLMDANICLWWAFL